MTATPEDVERSRLEVEAAQIRAARDAEIFQMADTVVADSAAARTANGWADAFRELFRG